MTVTVGNVREWRGEDVLDESGDKIGSLEAVYVDTTTDEPAFATVEVGGLIGGRRLVFVPLAGATVGPRYLRVAHPRKQVKEAPSIEFDGELPAERELFGYYHLGHQPGPGGARRLGRR
jgi:hypothetical protein